MKNIIILSTLNTTKKLSKRMNNVLSGTNRRVAYIPASYCDFGWIEKSKQVILRELGFESLIPFPLGEGFDEELETFAFESAAIYLGGGNTFEFLYMLKDLGLLQKLKDYVKRGGILMGVSAGGIMMCETIGIAGFADNNYLDATDLDALGLVPFNVKPHWGYWKKHKDLFCEYAKQTKKDIFCIEDGQAIWVTDNGIKYYGGMPEIVRHE